MLADRLQSIPGLEELRKKAAATNNFRGISPQRSVLVRGRAGTEARSDARANAVAFAKNVAAGRAAAAMMKAQDTGAPTASGPAKELVGLLSRARALRSNIPGSLMARTSVLVPGQASAAQANRASVA